MADFILEDDHAVKDLTQFLQRLERAGAGETRLRGDQDRLSVMGSTLAPRHLDDPTPLVLVHRGVRLAQPIANNFDVVVDTRSILDRLARLTAPPFTVPVPPMNLQAIWAGVTPPRSGWERTGSLDATSVTHVAEEGAKRVASLLPENPGQPLVDQARLTVWSLEMAPGVPAGAAFALDALGFVRDESPVRLHRNHTWTRLSTPYGEVFVRR